MQSLRERADDPAFQAQWREVKAVAKQAAMARITALTGVQLPAHALLDVQVLPSRPALYAPGPLPRRGLPAHISLPVADHRCRHRWCCRGLPCCLRPPSSLQQCCAAEGCRRGRAAAQVKRIHAYKRQLLNVLGVIHRYHAIKAMSAEKKAKVRWRLLLPAQAAPRTQQQHFCPNFCQTSAGRRAL